MNDRIKQLAEQSFVITTDGKIGHVNNYMVEKFADLIVGECMEVVMWAISMHCTIEEVPALIKEHFGIPSTL